jgi:hypothetical protein
VDRALLPPDAEFKGDDSVVVQDLVLATDKVLFLRESYYSPAPRRTFRAPQRRQPLTAVAAARAPDGDGEPAALRALWEPALPGLGPQQRQRVLEAGARAASRAPTEIPVGETLVCDAAPQFRKVRAHGALCWGHAGRHYPQLRPGLACPQELVARCRHRYCVAHLRGFRPV